MHRRFIKINSSLCTGCRICEMACSFYHYHQASPARSRIRVIENPKNATYVPAVCQNCEKPICKEVCPENAIIKDENTPTPLIDQKKCIKCKLCLSACPLKAISSDAVTGKIIKCDLCEGNPQCVQICPMSALDYDRSIDRKVDCNGES